MHAPFPCDLHCPPPTERFAICQHNTYEIAAIMTQEFLDRLTVPPDRSKSRSVLTERDLKVDFAVCLLSRCGLSRLR